MAKKFLPSINGLRAISILSVIMCHLVGMKFIAENYTGISWLEPLEKITYDHFIGVNVFFVISGFLITSLLLQEEWSTKTISLKNFFIRRTLRIFPAYYFLLIVYLVLQKVFHVIDIHDGSWLTAVTYTKYFNWQANWFTSHAWSLSIEEHFYLLWPLIFLRGDRFRKNAAVILILIVPVFRILMHVYQFGWLNEQTIFTRIDSIAIGCFFALHQEAILKKMSPYWRILFYGSIVMLFALPYLPALAAKMHLGFIFIPLGLTDGTLANIAIAIIMMYSVFGPRGIWYNFLNLRALNYIGLLSYSIYLWQQLFIYQSEHWYNQYPLNVFLIFAAALFSYYIVEKPFLKLKSRFHKG
jgi:peptidoglycan/LPS O-acetylase OafA/YrhL